MPRGGPFRVGHKLCQVRGASAPVPGAPVPLRVLLPKKQLDFLMPGEGGRCGLPCFGFG